MDIEFDENKSISNEQKHGINFHDAKKMWDEGIIAFAVDYREEQRELHIGRIDGTIWTAIITYRNNKLRIISFRRSRPNEKEFYYQATEN